MDDSILGIDDTSLIVMDMPQDKLDPFVSCKSYEKIAAPALVPAIPDNLTYDYTIGDPELVISLVGPWSASDSSCCSTLNPKKASVKSPGLFFIKGVKKYEGNYKVGFKSQEESLD